MIVSTEGSPAQPPIAITLLGGVEPILTAAPSAGESFLTPWSLASAPAGRSIANDQSRTKTRARLILE